MLEVPVSCLKCLCHLLSLSMEGWKRENFNGYLVPQRETSIIPDGGVTAKIRSFSGFGLSVALYHGSAKYLFNLAWVSGTLLGSREKPKCFSCSLQQKNTAAGLYYPPLPPILHK